MGLAKIRIEPGEQWYQMRVFLNGEDISKYISAMRFEADVDNRMPIVILELVASVEIPEDLSIAHLVVYEGVDESDDLDTERP